jgi:FdhE protein
LPSSTRLLERAHEAWHHLLRARPDLGPAVELQTALITTVVAGLDALERDPARRVPIDPSGAAERLRLSQPAVAPPFDIPPAADCASSVMTVCAHLAAGGAAAAANIAHDIRAGRLNAASLVAASLSRDQGRIHAAACQMGFAPDLLWLAAELAAGPLAFMMQRDLVQANAEVAALVSGWPHGYCPICGSWPALAELKGGARILRCSFCAAAWQPQREACVYCGEEGQAFVALAPDPARADRRLELCEVCRGYLKAVPAGTLTPFPLLAVEDLATMDLDVAASERGFGRPAMRQFGSVG